MTQQVMVNTIHIIDFQKNRYFMFDNEVGRNLELKNLNDATTNFSLKDVETGRQDGADITSKNSNSKNHCIG